jgi:dihydrofolate reductase
VTFEQMRGYWPLQTDDTTGITDYLNDVSKYVVSGTLQDPAWERTTVLRSVDAIRALKSETGGDIVTTGSIRLVRELIAARCPRPPLVSHEREAPPDRALRLEHEPDR